MQYNVKYDARNELGELDRDRVRRRVVERRDRKGHPPHSALVPIRRRTTSRP